VLVVEDNLDVAESLRDLVEAFGHEVHVARSGDAALAQARQRPPDVVLCDIGLPGMTGYEVARAFRSDPLLRHARLVAVTGYAQVQDRHDAAEAGFDRHLGKPPDPSELERLLA
jgi:CheY-like chemotaxis protein